MRDVSQLHFVSVAEATLPLKASRERIIRRIQAGLLEGKYEDGKWFIARHEINAALARSQASEKSA